MPAHGKIAEALQVLGELGMPRAQQNERSALCLLALLGLTEEMSWVEAKSPLMGITPMMEFARDYTVNNMRQTRGKPFVAKQYTNWLPLALCCTIQTSQGGP